MFDLFSLDASWYWVAAAAALAGLVRGFAGFGAAMVYIPVASAIYEPVIAVVTLFIVDATIQVPLVYRAVGQCRWSEVLPLALGAALTVPVGVYALRVSDPEVLRWFISGTILVLVVILATGWRYQRRPPTLASFGVGGVAGFAGGVASLYGPPMVLFWLGGQSDAPTVRANVIVFFALIAVVSGLAFWWNDLFTQQIFEIALLLIPFYAIAIWLGARSFRFASERIFRFIAFALIAVIAVSSLPAWAAFRFSP